MDSKVNSFSSGQIADTIVEYVRRTNEISGFENFTDLHIMNNSDGLAFELKKYEVVAPSEGATHS